MDATTENWNEQGQDEYYDHQQQQYDQNDPNATHPQQGDYMMQQAEEVDDDDEEDDILDEMEDGNNGYDPNNGNVNGDEQGNLLLMKFCPHDSSMLYPKECKRTKTLRYACGIRGCNYSEETQTNMVYQNILKKEVKNVLHKVPSAVSDDPSLPRTQNESCESCGYNEAVFFQSDTSDVRSDTLALIFVCCSCGHKWVK